MLGYPKAGIDGALEFTTTSMAISAVTVDLELN